MKKLNLFFAFAFFLLFDFSLARQIVPEDVCNGNAGCSLLLFHDYEGDTNDKSGNGNDGTISGNGSLLNETLETGDSNTYLNLNGGYLSVNENFTVSASNGLTVMFWFRSSDLSGTYNVITKADEIAVCVGSTSVFRDNKGNGLNVSGLNLKPNVWHFYAASYDPVSNTVSIYIDGTLIKQGIEGTYQPSAGNSGFTFGSGSVPNGACSGNNFTGDLDNVIIINNPTSSSEIRRIYSIDPREYRYICSDTGAVYSEKSLCDSVCSQSCGFLVPSSATGNACDIVNYDGFVYYNNKTYAVSKTKGFWEDFSNLAIIQDANVNSLLSNILTSKGISEAWIGAYDPNYSVDYNTVNPSRFVWRDGTSLSFSNWSNGEPNNYIYNEDVGVVPVTGEHWAEMYSDGTWNDEGYHAYFGGDYKPIDYALVEWNGALDCVKGESSTTSSTVNTLIDQFCEGNTPCQLCSDGLDTKQCNDGPYFGGEYSLIYSKKQAQEVSFSNVLNNHVIMTGTGVFNYCSGTGECPVYDVEALLSYIVFKGDDGGYYWFGNPNSSPIFLDSNLNIQTLTYTINTDGNLEFDVPSGVNFISFIDYESISGFSVSDNEVNFSIKIYRTSLDWLCPITGNCLCPDNSTWNDATKQCEKEPDRTCSSSFYTVDTNNTSKCISNPLCSNNGTYTDVRRRCEISPLVSCNSGYQLDSQNNVCYSTPYCESPYVWSSVNNRCEKPATLSCQYGTLNTSTNLCEYSPTCDVGTLQNGVCIITALTSCSLGTYDATDKRIEWAAGCNLGTYSSSNDRCEWQPLCKGTGSYDSTDQVCYASVSESCPSNYTIDLQNDRCVGYDTVGATPTCNFGSFNPATNRCEYLPSYECSLEKSSCITPSAVYSCQSDGTGCSYSLQDGTVYNFDSNCSVSVPCGILSGGQSCNYNDGSTAVDCIYANSVKTPVCPYGDFVYDSASGKCVSTNVIYSCPSGYTLVGGVCQKEVYTEITRTCEEGYSVYLKADGSYTCKAPIDCSGGYFDSTSGVCYNSADCKGGQYDATQDVCYSNFFFTCPEGFAFDTALFESTGIVECEKTPSCVYGGTVNSTGNCELQPSSDCGSALLDLQNSTCYTDKPLCDQPGVYMNSSSRCEAPILKSCSFGQYDQNLDTCFFDPYCEDSGIFDSNLGLCYMDSISSCNVPFAYNSGNDVCQTSRVCDGLTECNYLESCPPNMTYSVQYGKCISDPVCSLSGFAYDLNTRKCIGSKIGTTVCPAGYTRNGDFCEGPPITKTISASGENASTSISLIGKTLISTGTVSYDNVDERFYVCVNNKLVFYSHNAGDFKYSVADNVSCDQRPNTDDVYYYSNSGTSIDLRVNIDSPTIKVGTLNFYGRGSGSGTYTYTYCDGIGTYQNGVCKVYPVLEYTFTDYVLRGGDWVGPGKYTNCSDANGYGGVCLTQSINVKSGDYVEIYKDVSYACDDDSSYFTYSVTFEGQVLDSGYYTCPNGSFTKKIGFPSGGTAVVEMKYMNSSKYDWVKAGFKHYYPNLYCPSPSVEQPDGKCYLNPTCNEGTLEASVSGYCEEFQDVDVVCPLDPSLPCIEDSTTKKLMCSPYTCFDAQTESQVVSTDTTQGANDKQADGQIDENGNCVGTIYIFNGQDRRCRPSGTQTAFNDCCKKDKIALLGLVSLGSCNSDEVVLAGLRNSEDGLSQCHYVGDYCAEKLKWTGGSTCLQKKKTFCCFGSILSRIIQEQGRQQIGIGWGTPENPVCRGFTPEEFQNIDFGKIDFSEFESTVKRKAVENLNTDKLNQDFKAHINDIFNK